LHLQQVGVHDDFHALGGRSIHLVRLHGWLHTTLGVDLDITSLFQVSTIAELSAVIERRDEGILTPDFDLVEQRARAQRQAYHRLRQNRQSHERGSNRV
jgi:aryl carrier-like protein